MKKLSFKQLPVMFFALAYVFVMVCVAHAGPALIVTGEQVTMTGKEPVTNEDGTELSDLDYCTVYWKKEGMPSIMSDPIPATSPTGGGDIFYQFIVPSAPGDEFNIIAVGTCTDTSGNQSAETAPVIKRIDRNAPSTWQ